MSNVFRKLDKFIGVSDTPDWVLYRIKKALTNNVTELDLSIGREGLNDYLLTHIPSEVFELTHLKVLRIRGHLLTAIDKAISRLVNLEELDLRNNHLTIIPEAICELLKLQTLDLSGNKVSVLPSGILRLRNLRELGLASNDLRMVPELLTKLQNLEVLDLSNNQIFNLPDSIGDLANLIGLGLGYNKISRLPRRIGDLKNLQVLNLISNHLRALPKTVTVLNNLRSLHLSDNELAEVHIDMISLRSLESLYLDGNPLESPPPEIINLSVDGRADIQRMQTYFRQLTKGDEEYLYEAKLIIVGEPGAGKTSLAKKIVNHNYQLKTNETSTKGIDIFNWHFEIINPKSKEQLPLRINIWDFGGQDIYHATHQFFLTHRSLYILMADSRREDTDFYYWLSVVELLSGKSPLLIVANEIQDRHRPISDKQLRAQFNSLKETLATNLATNRGLDVVLDHIKHQIVRLPHIGNKLPKAWVQIRKKLEQNPNDFITTQQYLDLCEENNLRETEDKLQLLQYFHDLGVCLHFSDDSLLKRIVILNPEWGTDAVYKVLDNERIRRNLGLFFRSDLEEIWSEKRHQDKHEELLHLMMKFQLCYKIPNESDWYIAPQLLTEDQPDYDWDASDNLLLKYRYEFMPKGIMLRFIVAMHRLIWEQKYVWKSGVILDKDDTLAEVIEFYGKRETRVRICGKHKKALFTIVMYELDNIHNSFKELKYETLVPCNCEVCKGRQEPHFYRFDSLRKRVAAKRYEVECDISFDRVNILALIDDIGGRKDILSDEVRDIALRTPEITDILLSYFTLDELKSLSTQLGVDFEDIGGEGKSGKVRELLEYLKRHGKLLKLVEVITKERPSVFRQE